MERAFGQSLARHVVRDFTSSLVRDLPRTVLSVLQSTDEDNHKMSRHCPSGCYKTLDMVNVSGRRARELPDHMWIRSLVTYN